MGLFYISLLLNFLSFSINASKIWKQSRDLSYTFNDFVTEFSLYLDANVNELQLRKDLFSAEISRVVAHNQKVKFILS